MTDEIGAPDDIVLEARKLYDRDKTAWSQIYERAREDLFFLSDNECAQWDSKEYNRRIDTARPALTIDQLGQFIHQVVNDIRQNTPSINIIPGDEEADEDTAQAFQKIIRGIEYKSKADIAYDTSASFSVKSSIGFIRIDHKYSNNYSFDQELRINRVINPLAILIDSDSVELDGCDQKHAHAVEKMTVAEFKRRWPDKDPVCYDAETLKYDYKDEDYIYVAEFFQIKEEKKTIEDKNGKIGVAGKERKGKTREVSKTKVMRYWLSGREVLEETTFPGKYIPIVPVYGEEAWDDGKRNLFSLIRKSKGAQMMFNLWKSLETEMLLKQPQAPVLAAAGSVENYKDDWIRPDKSMVLRYDQKDEDGEPYNKPERLQPPTIPTGIVNAARETVDDIKATMGMYNASIGRRGTATSGIQEQVQQREGDVATYHFGDNLRISINHVGNILVSAVPEIYDTERVIMGINLEDEPEQIGINGKMVEGQEKPVDLTKGQYEVRVTTGPSYTTQRQETAAVLSQLFQTQPELMQVYGDLYFKNSDFTGADAMAERAKKLIQKTNPDLIEGEDGQEPPNPQLMQAQQIIQQGAQALQELQQQTVQLQQQLKQAEAANASQKMQDDLKAQIDKMQSQQRIATLTISGQEKDLEIQKLKAIGEIDQAAQKLQEPVDSEAPQEDDENMLAAKLQTVQQRKMQKQQQAEQQQQLMLSKQEQDEDEKVQKTMQQNMLLDGILSIKNSLDKQTEATQVLAATIQQPKKVTYNPDGSIAGVQ